MSGFRYQKLKLIIFHFLTKHMNGMHIFIVYPLVVFLVILKCIQLRRLSTYLLSLELLLMQKMKYLPTLELILMENFHISFINFGKLHVFLNNKDTLS